MRVLWIQAGALSSGGRTVNLSVLPESRLLRGADDVSSMPATESL